MEGWTWKALCNEAPFRFGKNLASSGIRTRDPMIMAEVGSAKRSATRTLQITFDHNFVFILACGVISLLGMSVMYFEPNHPLTAGQNSNRASSFWKVINLCGSNFHFFSSLTTNVWSLYNSTHQRILMVSFTYVKNIHKLVNRCMVIWE